MLAWLGGFWDAGVYVCLQSITCKAQHTWARVSDLPGGMVGRGCSKVRTFRMGISWIKGRGAGGGVCCWVGGMDGCSQREPVQLWGACWACTWSPLLQGELLAGSIPTGLCAPLGSQGGCQPRLGLQPTSLLLCCPVVPTANPNCKGEWGQPGLSVVLFNVDGALFPQAPMPLVIGDWGKRWLRLPRPVPWG